MVRLTFRNIDKKPVWSSFSQATRDTQLPCKRRWCECLHLPSYRAAVIVQNYSYARTNMFSLTTIMLHTVVLTLLLLSQSNVHAVGTKPVHLTVYNLTPFVLRLARATKQGLPKDFEIHFLEPQASVVMVGKDAPVSRADVEFSLRTW